MLVREPLTVKDLEAIKEGFDNGKTQAEIAKELKRAGTVVRRVKLQIDSGKFLQRLANVQQREVERKRNGKPLPVVKVDESGARRRRIQAMRARGLSIGEVAKKFKTTTSNVSYHFYNYNKKNGHIKAAKKQAWPKSENLDFWTLKEKFLALKKTGLTAKQIAAQLGFSHSVVHYHLYANPKKGRKEHLNGVNGSSRNGTGEPKSTITAQENILLGFAYAETERFIGLLGERLRLSTEILRPGLSKLLGHSPIR